MRVGFAPARCGAILAVLAALLTAAGCRSILPTQYEYDEQIELSLDGSAIVYINGSVPALVALHGIDLDVAPTARLDRAAIRSFYGSDTVRVARISTSRRKGRRFVHVRLDVDDICQLGSTAAFARPDCSFRQRDGEYVFRQTITRGAVRDVGDVGWTGGEQVAFRLHLPSRIHYHNAPSKRVERGNILLWEQSFADRLAGRPVEMEARMAPESILYTTLWLFGTMALVVIALFGVILWWLMRRKA
ncbi:MAG TPA: hypothetical protein VF198_10420 [Vicinamibacterales bacterium]